MSSHSSTGLCKTQMPKYEKTRGSIGRNTLYLEAKGQVVHRHLRCDCAAPALLYFSPCQGKQGTAYIFCRKSLGTSLCSIWTIPHCSTHSPSGKSKVHAASPLCLLTASGGLTFREDSAKPTRINRTPHYFSL